MAIKPILMNTEMVRAIIDGRKTVTRRIVKPQHLRVLDSPYHKAHPDVPDKALLERLRAPPYSPGDILWVREKFAGDGYDENGESYVYGTDVDECGRVVWGDINKGEWAPASDYHWCPSIHMPREAARIWLRVTDVRVERLQEIKNHECVAEGAVKRPNYTKRHDLVLHNRYRQEFAELWDSTIKPVDRERYGWAANPWVWRVVFERCEKPEAADDG